MNEFVIQEAKERWRNRVGEAAARNVRKHSLGDLVRYPYTNFAFDIFETKRRW